VRGDFGFSFVYKTRTVAEILKETFPISLFLGSMALALAVAGGLTLGILAAVHQTAGGTTCPSRSRPSASPSRTSSSRLPDHPVLVHAAAVPHRGWTRRATGCCDRDAGAAPMGIIARFTRASMLEVIRADYTLTARAKGLSEAPSSSRHALKNALIPVVTLLGPLFAAVGTDRSSSSRSFACPAWAASSCCR